MTLYFDSATRCWDCIKPLCQGGWKWRPHGYHGLVCDDCAQRHIDQEKRMTRQYDWEICYICREGTPDHYMTCVNKDSSVKLPDQGHTFHLQCLQRYHEASEMPEARKKEGPFCPTCRRVCRDFVPVCQVRSVDEVDIDGVGEPAHCHRNTPRRNTGYENWEDLNLSCFLDGLLVVPDPEETFVEMVDISDVKLNMAGATWKLEVEVQWKVQSFFTGGSMEINCRTWESHNCLENEPRHRLQALRLLNKGCEAWQSFLRT